MNRGIKINHKLHFNKVRVAVIYSFISLECVYMPYVCIWSTRKGTLAGAKKHKEGLDFATMPPTL